MIIANRGANQEAGNRREAAALQQGKSQEEAHVDVMGLAAAAPMKGQRCQGKTEEQGCGKRPS